jgi:hypothetical protein
VHQQLAVQRCREKQRVTVEGLQDPLLIVSDRVGARDDLFVVLGLYRLGAGGGT